MLHDRLDSFSSTFRIMSAPGRLADLQAAQAAMSVTASWHREPCSARPTVLLPPPVQSPFQPPTRLMTSGCLQRSSWSFGTMKLHPERITAVPAMIADQKQFDKMQHGAASSG